MSNKKYTGVHNQCDDGGKEERGDRRKSKEHIVFIDASKMVNINATAFFVREHCECSICNGDRPNYNNHND